MFFIVNHASLFCDITKISFIVLVPALSEASWLGIHLQNVLRIFVEGQCQKNFLIYYVILVSNDLNSNFVPKMILVALRKTTRGTGTCTINLITAII